MEPDSLTLSQDAFNAHMLGSVMDATSVPGETPTAARTRCAAIVEMFRTFDAANAMESMIACHCISLQFVLNAAMRDAGNIELDPAVLTRVRASAMTISKTLHLWMSKYEAMHTRNETRAAEAPKRPVQPETPPVVAPAHHDQPRPLAAQPPKVVFPAMKDALLASTAILPNAVPNGRVSVAPS
jgi:hypothetical protein